MTETAATCPWVPAGASSTMRRKQNPVRPQYCVALGHQFTASVHASGRCRSTSTSATAWRGFAEWMPYAQLTLSLAAALNPCQTPCRGAMTPHPVKMPARWPMVLGLIHAEALSFHWPKPCPAPKLQKIQNSCVRTHGQAGAAGRSGAGKIIPTCRGTCSTAPPKMGQGPRRPRGLSSPGPRT